MYRRPGYGGRSKASADTLCQKCLKRGHYSYECKAPAQERPYKSRPSRTQQLLNPQLKPKLTTEVPNDLLRKKGVADEILAKKEKERGRKNGRDLSLGRSRSVSSDSISTISTNRSPSRSPAPKRVQDGKPEPRDDKVMGKRRRRSLSSESSQSLEKADRYTRRRMSSMSPERRGRRRTRSRSSRMDISPDRGSERRENREHRSGSKNARRRKGGRRSTSRDRERRWKQPNRELSLTRSPSRSPNRMDTTEDQYPSRESPAPRKRWDISPKQRRRSPSDSRSRSPYRRASPSPFSRRRARKSPNRTRPQDGQDRGRPHDGPRQQFHGRQPALPPTTQSFTARTSPPRERSLSPYSKRLALTQQMQRGN